MDDETLRGLEGLPEVFSTTDFDMAACLMSLTIKIDEKRVTSVDVLGAEPCVQSQHNQNRRPVGRGYRFRFLLTVPGIDNPVEKLRQLELDYTNVKLNVEPTVFMSRRKQLRVILDRKIRDLEAARQQHQARRRKKEKKRSTNDGRNTQ